jgi:hypothetical protein
MRQVHGSQAIFEPAGKNFAIAAKNVLAAWAGTSPAS